MSMHYKSCSKCGNDVHFNARKCKNCGEKSPWSVDQEQPEIVDQEPPKHSINIAYMVARQFSISNPVTQVFPQGKIIRDPVAIERLLKGGAPLIAIEDESLLKSCPCCGHTFLCL